MPRANQDLSIVDPTEIVNITADTFPLAVGETLSAAAWSIALISGVDAAPNTRLIGAPTIPAPSLITIQRAGTFQAGAIYDIMVSVNTTAGQTLSTNAHLQCQSIG